MDFTGGLVKAIAGGMLCLFSPFLAAVESAPYLEYIALAFGVAFGLWGGLQQVGNKRIESLKKTIEDSLRDREAAEVKAHKAEQRAIAAEARAESAEARAESAEARAESNESRIGAMEAKLAEYEQSSREGMCPFAGPDGKARCDGSDHPLPES